MKKAVRKNKKEYDFVSVVLRAGFKLKTGSAMMIAQNHDHLTFHSFFCAALAVFFLGSFAPSQAQTAEPLIIMVTPRGETVMETVFEADLKRRLDGKARFLLIKPDMSNPDEAAALPERLRQEKPALIYTWGTPVTQAVAGKHDHPLIADIPIIFAVVADPLRAGVVPQLKKTGRNVTGTMHLAPLSVQINAIQSFRPFKKLGVVYNASEQNARDMLEDLKAEARRADFELIAEAVSRGADGLPDPASLPGLIHQVKARGAEWLYIGPDTFVGFTHRKITTNAAIAAGLPSFTANESAIRNGNALFGLFSPQENMSRFVALKAAQILKGEAPVGAIPIETLQRFSVLINMCAARALGVFPPLPLLNVADVRLPGENDSASTCLPLDGKAQTAMNPGAVR